MSKKVILYSKNTCGYCILAKQFLEKQGIEYEVVNVSRNLKVMEKLLKATGSKAVPQINIDGEWVVGFDPKQIMDKMKK